MGHSQSKIKNGKSAKNSQAVDSNARVAKRTRQDSKKVSRTERKPPSTLLSLRPGKKKSKTLGKRFSKRNKHSQEKKVKSLLQDNLSLASTNSTESKVITTTVDSRQSFTTDDLPRLDPSSDHSLSWVRKSTILLGNDSGLDKDPLPPSNLDKNDIKYHVGAEVVAQTAAENSESISILELEQPMFKYQVIETSVSTPTDDLAVDGKSENSLKPVTANDQRHYVPVKVDSYSSKSIPQHPLHVYTRVISASCACLDSSMSEQLPPSLSRDSMHSSGRPLAPNLKLQASDRQKSSDSLQVKTEDRMILKPGFLSLCDVRLVCVIFCMKLSHLGRL